MDTVTVGLDLGDRYSRYCAIDGEGMLIDEGRVRTEVDALRTCFKRAPARVVLEVGTHSPWVSRIVLSIWGDRCPVFQLGKVCVDIRSNHLDSMTAGAKRVSYQNGPRGPERAICIVICRCDEIVAG